LSVTMIGRDLQVLVIDVGPNNWKHIDTPLGHKITQVSKNHLCDQSLSWNFHFLGLTSQLHALHIVHAVERLQPHA